MATADMTGNWKALELELKRGIPTLEEVVAGAYTDVLYRETDLRIVATYDPKDIGCFAAPDIGMMCSSDLDAQVAKYPHLCGQALVAPVILLSCNDYAAPELPKAAWLDLIALMNERQVKHLSVMCKGGLGRTGTILCCLLGAVLVRQGELTSATSLIQFVREHYAKKAVESNTQVDYLVRLWGK